jgi:PiT family inorganic phosphate transporter
MGAIVWNLITWWLGLPSSSSHALIGGLCGAAVATAGGDLGVLKWGSGLMPKVVIPMVTSPVIGFAAAAILMLLLLAALRKSRPHLVQSIFGKLQLVSAAWMAHSHGTNDAQKTMGIIALALFTGTSSGAFDTLPETFGFLRTPEFRVPQWVMIICAITMAAGTAAGGWRIIRTLGHKMVKLQPVHGFAAETTAAVIIQVASSHGIPLSTTHVITTSIMGVGAAKRFSAVKWGVVERIIWAWVLTLPVTALIGYLLARAAAAF